MNPDSESSPWDDRTTALPLTRVEQSRPTALRYVRALAVTTVIAMALGIIADAFRLQEWPVDWAIWLRGSSLGAFIRLAPELASSLLYAQQRWGLESLRLVVPGEVEVIGDGRGEV